MKKVKRKQTKSGPPSMKLTIKDIEWTFKKIPHKEYTYKHGKDDSDGITFKTKRIVEFDDSIFSKSLVAHELLHVYVASCCTTSTDNISQEDMEEICAEIVECHLDDMKKYRDLIYRELK